MSLEVYNNPFLYDFIRVCAQMPQDDREQLEAFTGQPYDIDGCALGNATAPGPKWVVKHGEDPIMIGGFVPQRPGVWRDFLLTTPGFREHWFACTRICRRLMDAMFLSRQAHRIECIAPALRVSSRNELSKWYKVLGYNKEGVLHGYCANGADAVIYSRVKH